MRHIQNRYSVVEITDQLLSSLALNIWWEAIMTVGAAWSSNVVNLALDKERNASSRAERVLGSQ